MHANLMRTTGFKVHGNQCRLTEAFHHIPMGDGLFAGGRHAKTEIRDFGATDRCFDGCFVFPEIALHERMIGFHDFMFGELPAHFHVGEIGLAYEHQTGCAHVEAGYDALTPCSAIRGDVHSPVKQTAEHRRTGPADGSMSRHTHRLVNHHQIVIFVDHGHIMCDRFRLGSFLDNIEFHGFA